MTRTLIAPVVEARSPAKARGTRATRTAVPAQDDRRPPRKPADVSTVVPATSEPATQAGRRPDDG